jgi:hypothetical protein
VVHCPSFARKGKGEAAKLVEARRVITPDDGTRLPINIEYTRITV